MYSSGFKSIRLDLVKNGRLLKDFLCSAASLTNVALNIFLYHSFISLFHSINSSYIRLLSLKIYEYLKIFSINNIKFNRKNMGISFQTCFLSAIDCKTFWNMATFNIFNIQYWNIKHTGYGFIFDYFTLNWYVFIALANKIL